MWTLAPSRLPWVLAGCFAALYAVLSLRRHDLMGSHAYDLGIFDQAVRGYADGTGPVVDLKGPGFNLLGDHFSPILALLAPVYQALPYAATLLVSQAVLMALSIVPISRWALRAVGARAAWTVGVGVGASWGIVQAIAFDFHEIAFAVPLLAFSVAALGGGRLRAACLWALPLVLVKEDLGLTVAVIGLLVAARGARRAGLLTAAAGVAATTMTVLVVIPAFNPDGDYPYSGKLGGRSLVDLAVGAVNLQTALTLLLLLAPTALLALRSPLLLVAVPTLIWRFASDNPAFHGTDYHYNAVIVPVAFAAFVDVLRRSRPAAVGHALLTSAAVTVLLVPFFPLRELVSPPRFERAAAVDSARDTLSVIPDGATVATSNTLAPQLSDRTTVSLLGAGRRPAICPQYIALDNNGIGDLLDDDFPASRIAVNWLFEQALATGYGQAAADSWVTVLRYTGHPDRFYADLVADGPPTYLTDPADGGTERAADFTWHCTPPA